MQKNLVPAKVVAEISCVHLGKLDRAKELCKLAKLCGADYVKTQKRNPDESVPADLKNQPHPNQIFAYGNTYLEHRKNLELTIEQHAELKNFCENIGIGYACSVWDMTSAKEIVSLNPDFIKIPSACNQHFEMLYYLRDEYKGDVHVSTGMSTPQEMSRLFGYVISEKMKRRIVVYHCTSKYPCDFKDLHLLELKKYNQWWKDSSIRIGFSNHGKGIAVDLAAFMLGATWIERHFIDDRTIRHTDAAASLEPAGLQKLCRDLKVIIEAMTERPFEMDDAEKEQRKKLKYNGENNGF